MIADVWGMQIMPKVELGGFVLFLIKRFFEDQPVTAQCESHRSHHAFQGRETIQLCQARLGNLQKLEYAISKHNSYVSSQYQCWAKNISMLNLGRQMEHFPPLEGW